MVILHPPPASFLSSFHIHPSIPFQIPRLLAVSPDGESSPPPFQIHRCRRQLPPAELAVVHGLTTQPNQPAHHTPSPRYRRAAAVPHEWCRPHDLDPHELAAGDRIHSAAGATSTPLPSPSWLEIPSSPIPTALHSRTLHARAPGAAPIYEMWRSRVSWGLREAKAAAASRRFSTTSVSPRLTWR